MPPSLQQVTLNQASAGDSWTLPGKSGSVFCGVTAPLSWVLVCIRFCLCPPRVCCPVLCKFWRLHAGVNGALLQEGLHHTQVCCMQSPCPCGSPLLTHTSQETLTHSSVSVRVVSLGPGTQRVCLSPLSVSGVWGLILNVILPIPPSCWGFSFSLDCWVSPQIRSSAVQPQLQGLQLAGASLPLDMGY